MQRLMLTGEIEVELVPQGNLVKRIRAGEQGISGCEQALANCS